MKANPSLLHKLRQSLRTDRALRFVWQAAPGWTVAGVFLLFIQGLLPLATLYLIKLIVDAAAAGIGGATGLEAFRGIAILIGLAGAVALLNSLCQLAVNFVREGQTQIVTDHMYGVLHAKSVAVDLAYYENPEYFDNLHRAQQEGPFRPTMIVNGMLQLGQNTISLAAVAGLLLAFNWGISVVLFAAAIPGVLVRIKFAGKHYQWQRKRTQTERKAYYFNRILTGDTHAKEVRLFGLNRIFMDRFRGLRDTLRKEKLDLSRQRAVADFWAQAGATVAVFGAFGYIAYHTIQGTITIGDMVMYYQAFQRGMGFLQGILGGLSDLYENNLFLSNLYDFLSLKPQVEKPVDPLPVPIPLRRGLHFKGVHFQYPGATTPALRDITFSIRPGEVAALVGENGSGKTTLIKLLCRLYDPSRGSIAWDGRDLKAVDPEALRKQISVIFQDYVKYHMTLRENIWLGNIDLGKGDDTAIEVAARRSGAYRVLARLPRGYDTVLGKWFEEGVELSIGEWQMVALARAFLRDAQVIVLDEPTSALDARAEYELFKKFKQLMSGRTAVLISHRFSTVRMADRIFVLNGGRLIEAGTHNELMALGGQYAELYRKKARNYTQN